MPADHTLIERYEYKYRVPPPLVNAIRQRVSRYCELDHACASGPYLISSLYLDSPHRLFYRHSKHRRAQRLKLRVRRYVSGPLYLEEKRTPTPNERDLATRTAHRGLAAALE